MRELDSLRTQVDHLANEVVALQRAADRSKPRTGEVRILGGWWGSVERYVLAALIALMIFLGRHVWSSLGQLQERSVEFASIAAELRVSVERLNDFAERGPRTTPTDLLPLYECVGQQFEGRLRALGENEVLPPGDPTMLRATEKCLERLQSGLQDLRAR